MWEVFVTNRFNQTTIRALLEMHEESTRKMKNFSKNSTLRVNVTKSK